MCVNLTPFLLHQKAPYRRAFYYHNDMSISLPDSVLLSLVDHIFLPPKLPQHAPTEDAERDTNKALCHVLLQAIRAFSEGVSPTQRLLLSHMVKMMESVQRSTEGPLVETELKDAFSNLAVGGGPEFPPACCIIAYVHFQMYSLYMFELKIPLSLFAYLTIVFDSRSLKSLLSQAR